jgi:hypothetical protein
MDDPEPKRRRRASPTNPSIPLDTRGSSANTSTAGRLASAAWLADRRITPANRLRWEVEIALDVESRLAGFEFSDTTATRFHLNVYSEEWGYFFCHGSRASWIRITDIPFIHGRDDFQLLAATPPLRSIASLIRSLEHQFAIRFQRDHAAIRSDIVGADVALGLWVATL